MQKQEKLEENLKKAYSLVWGQCKPIMRAKIKKVENFENIAAECESIELLKLIKQIVYDVPSHQYISVAIYKTVRAFVVARQGQTETVQA